jgi:hypothetical protein
MNPVIWSKLNGQTSFSQPKPRDTAQIPMVLQVSIVDLREVGVVSRNLVLLTLANERGNHPHLAAALTALVTLNPNTLKQAILIQITPLSRRTILLSTVW